MRRRLVRRHVGEPITVSTPQGVVEGVLQAAPRSHAVIAGADGSSRTFGYDDILEVRTWSAANTLGALLDQLGRDRRSANGGIAVTPLTAVGRTIAVYACVSLRAEMVGSLPVHLYRRISQRERQEIDYSDSYPGSLARMLGSAPNPEMTAQEFWETVIGHHDLYGNFYGNVERDGTGRPRYIWPLNPAVTKAMRDPDTKRRFVRTHVPGGKPLDLLEEETIHIHTAVMPDGLNGLSPIGVARTAIGIEQSGGEYAERFFDNSAIPDGFLVSPTPMKVEDKKLLREQWQAQHGGLSNAHRVAILSGGLSWQALGMTSRDAEFLETRKYQVTDIARLYRTPPHLVGDVERSTSWGTGIGEQNVGFHVYTIRPILTRVEAACGRDLGFPGSRPSRVLADEDLYVAFDPRHLLRGDALTEAQVRAIERQWGVINANDWRADTDRSPIPGAAGETYLDPSNYVMVAPGAPTPAPAAQPASLNGSGG